MATNAANSTASREVVAAVHDAAHGATARVLELAATIASIPAPTNFETIRSQAFAELFRQEGLTDCIIDELGDVVARIPGANRNHSVLIAGHLDTVFPEDTDLYIMRSNGRIHGPGIGDNSLGAAAVLAIPFILRTAGITPAV